MTSRLWYMNADFETEIATGDKTYRRLPAFESLNRRLTPRLLWLAQPGDGLLVKEPWPRKLFLDAEQRGVELVSPSGIRLQPSRVFTPWGWTRSAISLGEHVGAQVQPVPLAIVAQVNSKLWSHALEDELGIAHPNSAIASSFEELQQAVADACPLSNDKWVVKSAFGFAARDRVLGRGPSIAQPQTIWCRKRFAAGESLIFQPWLEVVREYGVVAEISQDGTIEISGISDLKTNGAGTGIGYILGRVPTRERARELGLIARKVCERVFNEGYYGPVGIDSLEHSEGLHPLLEINARYTMGFVALAVEKEFKPTEPMFWSTKF